jgi:hypothetical protein
MGLEFQPSGGSHALDHARETGRGERRSAFSRLGLKSPAPLAERPEGRRRGIE